MKRTGKMAAKMMAMVLSLLLASGIGFSVFASDIASSGAPVDGAKTDREKAQTEQQTGQSDSGADQEGTQAGSQEGDAAQAGGSGEQSGSADGEAVPDENGEGAGSEAAEGEGIGAQDPNAPDWSALENENDQLVKDQLKQKGLKSKKIKAAAEAGDFLVDGAEDAWSFEDGVLTIKGDVTVTMKDDVDVTEDRIVIAKNAKVTLDGVMIYPSSGPAIKVDPGVSATLDLKEGSDNYVYGASRYAAVESGYEPGNLASLTIDGKGTLNAYAGSNSAAIGGSYNTYNASGQMIACYYGDINIKGGTVNAYTNGSSGAAIGSAANNRKDYKGDTMPSASYKMETEAPLDWGTITISGGTVNAQGNGGQSAGIGGGNHVDSGKIIISGGTIDASGYTGIGAGLGSSKYAADQKGPGSYFADIVINGGDITARGNDTGAGIGGAMYSDAIVEINGGTIKAYGAGRSGYPYGGAGIGGGYLGHANVTINGGTVYADAGEASAAAGIGSGGTPNANEKRGTGGRSPDAELDQTTVTITGGDVTALGGGYGGAGIGGGTGADKVEVNISGGTIFAKGSESNRDEKRGGAGIGSGYFGINPDDKYYVETDTGITITGGNITAIGGWGASGIGSGADNKTANSITIDADAADIEAYSDGTKFAIDTRTIDDEYYPTHEDKDRVVTGNLMQGTFVFPYVSADGEEQDTEGLDKIQLVNNGDSSKSSELTNMPDGYRSFARTVPAAGSYSVYTKVDQVAHGEGRFYNRCIDDTRTDEDVRTEQDIIERNVQYTVSGDSLSDNFYLFPVKSIVVDKDVIAEDSFKDGIDCTLSFALWQGGEDGKWVTDKDGNVWIETIEVVDGVPQGTAIFGCIDEGTYAVREVDPDDLDKDLIGTTIPGNDHIILVDIKTTHGDTDDNDATIDEDVWTDYVTVHDTYEYQEDPIDPDDPDDPEDVTPRDDPDDSTDATVDDTMTPKSGGKTRTDDMIELGLILGIILTSGALAVLTGRRRRERN